MQWFNNLKIGTKLISGFITVALIAGVIGFIGIKKIHQINEADIKLYEKITVPLSDMGDMAVKYQRVRINLRDYFKGAVREARMTRKVLTPAQFLKP